MLAEVQPGTAFTFQISLAYSRIVRSLENTGVRATFRIAFCVHNSTSRYSAAARCCVAA